MENLSDIRFLLILTLSFAGFFRISKLLNLRIGDISFSKDSIKLHVRKAKNDQAEEGRFIYIARTGKFTCPVALLELYIKIAVLEKIVGNTW